MIKGYWEKIESELAKICEDILDVLDKHLISKNTSPLSHRITTLHPSLTVLPSPLQPPHLTAPLSHRITISPPAATPHTSLILTLIFMRIIGMSTPPTFFISGS
jgi:hypothetical protein